MRLQDTLDERVWGIGSGGIITELGTRPSRYAYRSREWAEFALEWIGMLAGIRHNPPAHTGGLWPPLRDVDFVICAYAAPTPEGFEWEFDAWLCLAFSKHVQNLPAGDYVNSKMKALWELNEELVSPSSPAPAPAQPTEPPEYLPGPVWVEEPRGTSGLTWL